MFESAWQNSEFFSRVACLTDLQASFANLLLLLSVIFQLAALFQRFVCVSVCTFKSNGRGVRPGSTTGIRMTRSMGGHQSSAMHLDIFKYSIVYVTT